MLFLDPEQVKRLAEAVGPEHETLVYLLTYGGLRWGEAVALRRGRCNPLEIREVASDVDGTLHFGPTKTYESRTVPASGVPG